DPRVGRARHRAGPHPRLGGGVRRYLVAGAGPAGPADLRVGADEHRHRSDDPRRAGLVRVRRRGDAGRPPVCCPQWTGDGHAVRRDRHVGYPELRQGPAGADRPHRPPVGTGPVHRSSRGGAGMSEVDLAAQVLDLVRTLSGPGTQAEVLVERRTLALTRFANSYIHQNVADTTTTVRLRLHRDGRTAGGSTTLTVADALRDLVQRTAAASRLCPPDPGWPGLAPPSPVDQPVAVDEDVNAGTPADRAQRVRGFVH